jgi:catalase
MNPPKHILPSNSFAGYLTSRNRLDTVSMVPRQANQTGATSDADALVDSLIKASPPYRPGTRPIHAPGIAATGWFSGTPVASMLTVAPHYAGPPVPVTVRFSNGTGDIDEPDSTPAVRGMAVKFQPGTEDETDMVAMSLPMFFVEDVERFRRFVVAATPVTAKPRSRWQNLRERVRLDTPYPRASSGAAPSNDQGVFDFAVSYPPACPAVAYLGAKFVPESYTTCSFHAVHAFTLTGPDGTERSVRFHWEPVEGVRSASPAATGNFLRGGLQDWITNGRAEFVLRAQVAEQGDNTADPTRPWSSRRPRLVLGHLRLTDIPTDQFHGGELLSFNPTRLARGIGLSDDPTLAVRGEVYQRSFARRCPVAEAAKLATAH